jgi:hypothetical protein
MIVAGGNEVAGNPRKLFIMTGNDPIQVITGDGQVRTNIALPATDWTLSYQPYWGTVFLNRLWVFGNQNFAHQVYGSNVLDFEDFQTIGAYIVVPIFPGESERLISGYVFQQRLLFFKKPLGVYYIDTTNPAAPIPQKLFDSFGASSQQSIVQVLTDLWIGNTIGTISSLAATNALGGLEMDDIIKDLKCYTYISSNTNPLVNSDQKALWYEAKKQAFFTYHSPSGTDVDRIFVVDFQSGQARATFYDKDQPNCMCLVKDISLVQRPFYGSSDGFIYQMDQADRNVGGNGENNKGGEPYTLNFQLPYLDFSFVNPAFQETTKNFDFLEVTFKPTGNWALSADVFIDNVFIETISFTLLQSDRLDSTFKLDSSRLSGPGLRSIRRPMHGQGRRVSVRFYQPDYNHNVQISSVTFYFRVADQAQRSS